MSTIDFSTLSGERFEDLVEDLFKAMDYTDPPPERSGRGPDGGRDLIVTELRHSGILGAPRRFRWLVECKNFAKKSVQPRDIGSILDKISLHKADGYLLVTSTMPSTNVENRIRAIDRDPSHHYEALYWAYPRLVDELLKHRYVHEKYFGTQPAKPPTFTHWSKTNPFMELFPYEEDFAEYFFGRTLDTRNVVEKIYQKNLVLLYGASGVGKSSLIHAGVLPILRKEGLWIANPRIESNLSASALIEAILTTASLSLTPEFVTREKKNDPVVALRQIAKHLFSNRQRLVLILDQFESVFEGTPAAIRDLGEFLREAPSLTQQYRSVVFLFSMRSDYLDNLGIWTREHRISTLWANSYPVEKLSVSQATEVLVRAAQTVSARFSQETIEAILGDVKTLDEGRVYPPNLQIVASKVFDTARKQTEPENANLLINLEHYEAVGRAKGILESFVDEKLAEFGPEKDLAQRVLLALVSATGKRLSLSNDELSERLASNSIGIESIIKKLVQSRLLKPTDRTGTHELVHDVLASKLLETTEDDIRKAKAARESFELAVTAWKTDQLIESEQKLDWFYEYRNELNLGPQELLFLLISESRRNKGRGDFLGELFFSSQTETCKRRMNWISHARSDVCIQTLDDVLLASRHTNSDQALIIELAIDLCSAPDFSLQRELVAKLKKSSQDAVGSLYRRAYQSSLILTSATLSYLEETILGDIPLDTKRVIGYRMLEHHRGKETFPTNLLTDKQFQKITFAYLKDPAAAKLAKSRMGEFKRYEFRSYRIEMLKHLYEHDPNRVVKFLWEMLDLAQLRTWVGISDVAVLKLLRVYDPQRTIEEVSRTLDREGEYYSSNAGLLLEAMAAPETDELLVKDLDRYIQNLKGGSKRWRGGSVRYWREAIRGTIMAIGSRRLQASASLLATVALRDEPEKVKLDCVEALSSIGGDVALKTLATLTHDTSRRVRSKASKCLDVLQENRK